MKKLIKNLKKLIPFALILFIISCNTDDPGIETDNSEKDKISGFIQKGPYINGSSLMISELDSKLNPTGKVFNTQITDNKGTFELKDIRFESQYVELIANGYYFNENTGKVSESQLTLHAISDITFSSSINVNMLTELEKGRVSYLVSKGGEFKASKIQAQKEILKIFEISMADLKSSEYLDISKSGEDNSVLLAISIIVQGNRSEAELSELIAAISTDIKEDGILDDQELGQKLVSDLKFLNLPEVRQNIKNRYDDLGIKSEIPDFEKYIQQFTDNTKFIATSGIEYAEAGKYGVNILSPDKFDFTGSLNTKYSIEAKMAKGASLKVIFYPDYINDTTIIAEPKDIFIPGHYSLLYFAFYDNSGWGNNTDFYPASTIVFNTESDRSIDAEIELAQHGSCKIEIYENNQKTPTRIKQIKW